MTERDVRPPADYTPDRDLNIRAVVLTGIALAVATALAAVVSWWLSVGLRGLLEARDPAPPVLLEARQPHLPPSPNLQTDPEGELAGLRAAEDQALRTYAWSDDARTAARVPIERAMDLLLEARPGAEAFTAAPEAAGPESGEPAGAEGEAAPASEVNDAG